MQAVQASLKRLKPIHQANLVAVLRFVRQRQLCLEQERKHLLACSIRQAVFVHAESVGQRRGGRPSLQPDSA